MTAQIIDIASARQRFAPKLIARQQERMESALEVSRRRWLADLATWPSTFRESVTYYINEYMREPDEIRTAWGYARRSRITRRIDCGEWLESIESARSIPVDPEALLATIRIHRREADEKLRLLRLDREVRDPEHRRDAIERDSEGTMWTGRELQLLLWMHGVRRIDRTALLAAALEYVDEREAWIRSEIAYRRKLAERHAEAIVRGLTLGGLPYSERGLAMTKLRAAEREEYIRALEWRLAHVIPWARAHPVKYATGCLPRWARHSSADRPTGVAPRFRDKLGA